MPNRLAAETSPYLRQHADNPVEWWAWGDEALATARRERKPILLSIGYSACHWCHVMAHESFEDASTARVMNALYVNIKVDREERPDIDKVYQLAHQALARRGGGWPLTVFLTPDDLVPFFAGTYFPKVPRYGSPAFVQVLQGVRAWYDDKPDEVRTQNASLARFLAEHGRDNAHVDALDDAPIRHALERIEHGFDAQNGGHIGGPKFPHASEIELLLGTPVDGAREMARLTLARMAERGLTDHLAGGFFRYCVDERWEIPHFEKMLYDNAQLLPLYACAAHRFDEPLFAAAMRHCAGWLAHELQAPGGAFWSSLDADSEGEEGRYYVWQREEVRNLLDDVTFALVERHFGLDRPANFEQQAWHLLVARPLADVAGELGIGIEEAERHLADANAKLLAVRARRVRPGLDDKILTSWNALAIAGLARAAQWAEGAPFFAGAEAALDFLHTNVWIDGRLYACHAGGVAKFLAYLDDHAFLLDALLAMLRVRWNPRDLDWAVALADVLLERFEDREQGGFFFTAHNAEALPQRPKPYVDESLPAGNGIAARALMQLGHLLGNAHYIEAAERTLRAAWPTLLELPHACCSVLLALDEYLEPSPHLVVRHADHSTAYVWRAALVRGGDRIAAYFIPADAHDLPGVLGTMATTTNATAYLCTGLSCEVPITDRAEFETAMRRVAGGGARTQRTARVPHTEPWNAT